MSEVCGVVLSPRQTLKLMSSFTFETTTLSPNADSLDQSDAIPEMSVFSD
jgi:hypothetical protein